MEQMENLIQEKQSRLVRASWIEIFGLLKRTNIIAPSRLARVSWIEISE